MSTASDAIAEMNANEAFPIDAAFRSHYVRIARIIARVVHDHARAEELAVEVFLKLWRKRNTEIENVEAWLYRVAVRTGLDELRSRSRRARCERLFGWVHTNAGPATPEQIHRGTEEQERVRAVLGSWTGGKRKFCCCAATDGVTRRLLPFWA